MIIKAFVGYPIILTVQLYSSLSGLHVTPALKDNLGFNEGLRSVCYLQCTVIGGLEKQFDWLVLVWDRGSVRPTALVFSEIKPLFL